VWKDLDALAATWVRGDCFEPKMTAEARATLSAGWHEALGKTLTVRK
jgi:glycerol kinase